MAEIVLDHVTKKIRGSTVVDDISISFAPGVISGLKGVNGSGKTMLMRLVSGLIYPTSGEVRIDGKVLGHGITFPESIGVLIENPAFLGNYSGYENLEMLSSIRGLIDAARIHEVLETVGLSENANKKYKKYSLGMKQRPWASQLRSWKSRTSWYWTSHQRVGRFRRKACTRYYFK